MESGRKTKMISQSSLRVSDLHAHEPTMPDHWAHSRVDRSMNMKERGTAPRRTRTMGSISKERKRRGFEWKSRCRAGGRGRAVASGGDSCMPPHNTIESVMMMVVLRPTLVRMLSSPRHCIAEIAFLFSLPFPSSLRRLISSVPERSEGTEVMKIAIRSGKCFGVAGMREKCFGIAGVAH